MAGSRTWLAPAVGAGAVAITAVLAVVVNFATAIAPDWPWLRDGRVLWPAVVILTVLAVCLGWKAVTLGRASAQGDEHDRSRAVELMLIGDGDRTRLSVLNKDRYEVTNVVVECWRRGPQDANPPPPVDLEESFDQRVSYESIAGGGQLIRITDLPPLPNPDTAQGPYLGSFVLAPGVPTRIEFQVDWLDHQRRGRRLVGVADLTDFPFIGSIDLEPPEPLTTPPSRWARLKHTLGARPRRPAV